MSQSFVSEVTASSPTFITSGPLIWTQINRLLLEGPQNGDPQCIEAVIYGFTMGTYKKDGFGSQWHSYKSLEPGGRGAKSSQ